MNIKSHKIKDGEWFRPTMNRHLMSCCDCGLAHWMTFAIYEGALYIRAVRAPRYTAQKRKKMGVKLK